MIPYALCYSILLEYSANGKYAVRKFIVDRCDLSPAFGSSLSRKYVFQRFFQGREREFKILIQ
jgi:hypothetical protein